MERGRRSSADTSIRRRQAEEAAAEEVEKSEAQRHLAQQKIIRIDDRLK
jgi:hypothetical protein